MRLNFFSKLSKEDKIYYLSLPLIISLFIVSEYLLFKKGFYAISADESLHTLEAYKYFTGQSGLFSVWLPFQKVIYAAAFNFHYDLFLTPRVFSGLFGLFTMLSLIELSFQLFGNRIVSLMTGFFGAIFLPVYLFSVLPLEEIYFFFFTIFSVTFYLKWVSKIRIVAVFCRSLYYDYFPNYRTKQTEENKSIFSTGNCRNTVDIPFILDIFIAPSYG